MPADPDPQQQAVRGQPARPTSPREAARVRKPWRAWDTFTWSLLAALFLALALMAASAYERATGAFTGERARLLLGLLRNLTYPFVFVALGALAWHYVRFYRGDYARR